METDKGKYEITFETDSNGLINKVNSQKYEVTKVLQGQEITIDQKQLTDLYNSIQEYNKGVENKFNKKLRYINSDNIQDLLVKIQKDTSQAENALNRVRDVIKTKFPDSDFDSLIDSLISYSNQKPGLDLQIGDQVRVNNISYIIQRIGEQIVGKTETNEEVEFTQDDLNNMYKEELQCASVLLKLI